MAKKCIRDEIYLNYQKAFCKFVNDTYDMADATLAYMLKQAALKQKKCAVILDVDGTILHSEDDCASRKMFSRAMNFIKNTKSLYKQQITFFIITARPSDIGIAQSLLQHQIKCGNGKDIELILYDIDRIGTEQSKALNRQFVRDQGYTIICSAGDNYADIVPDFESDDYASTANFLLPNIYRHQYI